MIAVVVSSAMLSSCGGTQLVDHNYLAGSYAGTWSAPNLFYGHSGTMTLVFDPAGGRSGTLNIDGQGASFTLLADATWFDVNSVQLVFTNSDPTPTMIQMTGSLTKSGNHLSGTLKIPGGDFDYPAEITLNVTP